MCAGGREEAAQEQEQAEAAEQGASDTAGEDTGLVWGAQAPGKSLFDRIVVETVLFTGWLCLLL